MMIYKNFLFLAATLAILPPSAHAQWKPPTPVVVPTTVEKRDVQEGLETPGSFLSNNDVVIRSQSNGQVEKILFKDGEFVKKGQLLMTLHDVDQKAGVKKAEAALKLSRTQLGRMEKLKAKGFIAQAALDKVIATVSNDEAELSVAKEALSKTQVVAPFAGVLSSRTVSLGAQVQPNDELVRLHDLQPIRFEFQIPAKSAILLKAGQKITATTDAYPGEHFPGVLDVVESRVNDKTRNMKAFALFPNKDGKLKPGMFGHISVSTADRHSGLTIPEEALVVRRDGLHVFKVEKDGDELKAKLVKITAGVRSKDQVEVTAGLQAGEQIVLRGQDKIRDGAAIELSKPQG